MPRKPWEIPFLAEPREVAGLRRVMRLHLELWGLSGLADAAQVCVSELVSKVIEHVGEGTAALLAVSVRGTFLRIEVQDSGRSALPAVGQSDREDESGRGLRLVEALSSGWGVERRPEGKVTWCELATGLLAGDQHVTSPGVQRAESALAQRLSHHAVLPDGGPPGRAVAEAAAIGLIADLLNWLSAHGRDADAALDRAQLRFEVESGLATD
ncbi:ATP-binding protein [Streptomyces sp. NPDC047130]|uniref:ATP-binding protein n=1 Tax=Streptomyces sp. NPDC047130 TaxID=3155261 RepID=UPI0033F85FC4